MTQKKRLEWQNLLLILTAVSTCRSLEVSIPQEEYEAASGGDITLTCSFRPAKPDFSILILTWEANPDLVEDPMEPVATYYLNNALDIAPAYEGRASLEVDVAKQESRLRLTKLSVRDSRHFQCSVKIPNDDEGTTAASTSLLVLIAPSKPLCRLQGTAEYGHNVTLTCMSQEGSPQPKYAWKSYSVENIPRKFPPKATEKDGALSLVNISRETSGFYICESTNRVGSDFCNFTLAVMPGSMNFGSTAGIIAGVVVGFLLLGILIFCCYKKRSEKNKRAEGSPKEMEFSDTPEARTQYRDEEFNAETKESAYKGTVAPKSHNTGTSGFTREEDYGSNSGRYRNEPDRDIRRDQDHGGRDHLDRNESRGSRDRLDDQRNRYGGSRDRLEERNDYGGGRDGLGERNDYGGGRDRLEERNDYGGSRDGLGERKDYGGGRDRLGELNDYGGSRDRLDDQRGRYRLDDQRNGYGGSRDRLGERNDIRGSRDRLTDRRDRCGGSRDRLNDDYAD